MKDVISLGMRFKRAFFLNLIVLLGCVKDSLFSSIFDPVLSHSSLTSSIVDLKRRNRYISVGYGPFISFYAPDIDTSSTIASADALAKYVKSTMLGFAKSFIASGESSGNDLEKKSHAGSSASIVPATNVSPLFSIQDGSRKILSILASGIPDNELLALTDSLGRVSVFDGIEMEMILVFKGYREAQCSFMLSDEGSLYLAIYAPRRGIMEFFHIRSGKKIHSINVGSSHRLVPHGAINHVTGAHSTKCVLLKSDGTINTMMIPNFIVEKDEATAKKQRNLWKQFEKAVKNGDEGFEELGDQFFKDSDIKLDAKLNAFRLLPPQISTNYLLMLVNHCLKSSAVEEDIDFGDYIKDTGNYNRNVFRLLVMKNVLENFLAIEALEIIPSEDGARIRNDKYIESFFKSVKLLSWPAFAHHEVVKEKKLTTLMFVNQFEVDETDFSLKIRTESLESVSKFLLSPFLEISRNDKCGNILADYISKLSAFQLCDVTWIKLYCLWLENIDVDFITSGDASFEWDVVFTCATIKLLGKLVFKSINKTGAAYGEIMKFVETSEMNPVKKLFILSVAFLYLTREKQRIANEENMMEEMIGKVVRSIILLGSHVQISNYQILQIGKSENLSFHYLVASSGNSYNTDDFKFDDAYVLEIDMNVLKLYETYTLISIDGLRNENQMIQLNEDVEKLPKVFKELIFLLVFSHYIKRVEIVLGIVDKIKKFPKDQAIAKAYSLAEVPVDYLATANGCKLMMSYLLQLVPQIKEICLKNLHQEFILILDELYRFETGFTDGLCRKWINGPIKNLLNIFGIGVFQVFDGKIVNKPAIDQYETLLFVLLLVQENSSARIRPRTLWPAGFSYSELSILSKSEQIFDLAEAECLDERRNFLLKTSEMWDILGNQTNVSNALILFHDRREKLEKLAKTWGLEEFFASISCASYHMLGIFFPNEKSDKSFSELANHDFLNCDSAELYAILKSYLKDTLNELMISYPENQPVKQWVSGVDTSVLDWVTSSKSKVHFPQEIDLSSIFAEIGNLVSKMKRWTQDSRERRLMKQLEDSFQKNIPKKQ